MSKTIKYSTTFNTGGLLFNETTRIIDYLEDGTLKEKSDVIIRKNILKINAESSRGRVLREIYKRSKSVDNKVWRIFKDSNSNEQKILLFYVCCKAFKFILDFQTEVIINKFRALSLEITNEDVLRFIDKKSITYSEIEGWSEKRKSRITWSLFSVLEQVGILKDKIITPLKADDHFWLNFIKLGDPWFLELALLNKQQRDKIFELNK